MHQRFGETLKHSEYEDCCHLRESVCQLISCRLLKALLVTYSLLVRQSLYRYLAVYLIGKL